MKSRISSVTISRGLSFSLGNYFIKPRVQIDIAIPEGMSAAEAQMEHEKELDILWLRECLSCISEVAEHSDSDSLSDYTNLLMKRLEELES